MKVYLIRHAQAVDESPTLSDAQRFLTANGRRVCRDVGATLAEQGVELDAVVSSPLVRAVQTAELVAARLGYLGVIEILPSLGPGYPAHITGAALAGRGKAVAVVGHEPGISYLGAYLVNRPSFPPLRKGQVSLVDDGTPEWWVHPDTLAIDRLLVA